LYLNRSNSRIAAAVARSAVKWDALGAAMLLFALALATRYAACVWHCDILGLTAQKNAFSARERR
jgi:hypothetical protein